MAKLIYCTRTVPEMEKVLEELRRLMQYRKHTLRTETNILGVGLSSRKVCPCWGWIRAALYPHPPPLGESHPSKAGRRGKFSDGYTLHTSRSATIWASGRTRNPYFVILLASLLFDSRFRCFFHIGDMPFFVFHPVSPIFTPFYPFFAHFHHIHSFGG